MTALDDNAILEAARHAGRARLRTGIYTRLSHAAMDDTTKVDDQERICRELAARRGDMHIARVYTDNNASAWQPKRKRKGWDQMLADVGEQLLDAILIYHGDRLIRQPWDLETLLRLAESQGIRLFSPTGIRNLDSADDRFILRIEAAQACRESDNTSRRKKAQHERMRREGRVRTGGRGGRAYGFATDGVTHVTAECDHIRDMARMLLAGETTGALVRDAAARGARTPAGGEFAHGAISKMLRRPRYAGLMPDGENRAAWEPVLDRHTWERVRELLETRGAGYGCATNAPRWLLSGIAVCGAPSGDGICGAPLQMRPSKGRAGKCAAGYGCVRKGCKKTYRSAAHLDDWVGARVVAALADERNPQARVPASGAAAREWEVLGRERADTEAMIAAYGASAGRLALLMARLDGIDARLAELRDRESRDEHSRLLARYGGISRTEWEALPLDVRRALVRATVTVTVLPASGRGPGFRPRDVRVERRRLAPLPHGQVVGEGLHA